MKYQEDEIKAYCEGHGLNLIHIFRDEGISGAKLNEEALEIDKVSLQEMLAHLSSVRIDYVIVLNTSRLWRSEIVRALVEQISQKGDYPLTHSSQITIIFKKLFGTKSFSCDKNFFVESQSTHSNQSGAETFS